MMQEHHIPVTRTARFVSLGDLQAGIKEAWFVLHGYGQLAHDFIKAFEAIRTNDRLIVAPEALSRFYVHRKPDHIGASWMTREGRKHEINDYLAYLNQVALFVYDPIGRRVDTVVLGFSQGANTASRWVTLGRLPAKRLILWGGDVAHDLDLTAYSSVLNAIQTTFVVGDSDRYITKDRLELEEERMKQYTISYELVSYNGGHEIDEEVLQALV